MGGGRNANLVENRGGLIPAPGCHSADPEESIAWEQTAPRQIEPKDWRRFEDSIAEIFTAFGMDIGTVSTTATPVRFLKALYDATAGYEGDAKLLTASRRSTTKGPPPRSTRSSKGRSRFIRSVSTTRCRSTVSLTLGMSRTSRLSASRS